MTEEDSFRDFVQLRYGELLRTAFLLTGTAHGAEDLVQTVLLRAYRGWAKIDEPMPYLRKALVNQHISVWRRIGSREFTSAFQPEPIEPDPAIVSVQRAELLQALSRLPHRMRAVLVLRYWEDLSEAETAKTMGCSVGSVKAQASRGLARLRGLLQPQPIATGQEALV